MMPQSEKILENCLFKASNSFGRLSKRVWQSHSLRLSAKIQVYRAVVVPTLLYGVEIWVLYRKQIRLLERFHQRCLRSILGIKWQNHVSNEEVRQLAKAGTSHQAWQQEASDRDSWSSSVRKASCKFEVERHEAAKERCRRQKERAASPSSSAQTFICPRGSRV